MTPAAIAALTDDQLIEQLLVELTLGTDDDGPLSAEVLRRGLVEQATARVVEATADRRRRLG